MERARAFVKRTGYASMAQLVVHDKRAPDRAFEGFFQAIEKGAFDKRNFAKKGATGLCAR